MKKEKAQSSINLDALAGGAFAEKLNEALMQVAENIQNPNTDPLCKRGITVNIKFAPNKTRQMVNTSIAVTTKLAPTEAIETQMITGVNLKTGKVEIAEYDAVYGSQRTFFDMDQQEEDPAEAPAEETTHAQEPAETAGKPLDLRNRVVSIGDRAAKA